MEKYYATVSIKLKCLVEAEDMVEAIAKVENMELPKGYVENSFVMTDIVKANKKVKGNDSDAIIIK